MHNTTGSEHDFAPDSTAAVAAGVVQARQRVRSTPALAGALAADVLAATTAAQGRQATGPKGRGVKAGPCASAERHLLQMQHLAARANSIKSRWVAGTDGWP